MGAFKNLVPDDVTLTFLDRRRFRLQGLGEADSCGELRNSHDLRKHKAAADHKKKRYRTKSCANFGAHLLIQPSSTRKASASARVLV